MNRWILQGDRVQVGVTEEAGHLDPVRFVTDTGEFQPMHVAPWADEHLGPDVPPVLRVLRGDFLCAPFGPSDVLPDETRVHGATANGRWVRGSADIHHLEAVLEPTVMGARIRKIVRIHPHQAVVYQEHIFEGGSGSLPVGHHAMLRAPEPLYLGFSRWIWAGTAPEPLEPDPKVGRSLLAYPQEITDLSRVRLAAGGTADLSRYPTLEAHDDLVMLVADPKLPFAWSAATAPHAGWVWFALKSPRTLASTILWMSNGGRQSPPWSGRHTHVLGIEEVTTYFNLGHRASATPNPVSKRGIPTAITLQPRGCVSLRYAFGLAAAPPGFTRVRAIDPAGDGVDLVDEGGRRVHAAIDVAFITDQPRSA
jgi:hypothetical protein